MHLLLQISVKIAFKNKVEIISENFDVFSVRQLVLFNA